MKKTLLYIWGVYSFCLSCHLETISNRDLLTVQRDTFFIPFGDSPLNDHIAPEFLNYIRAYQVRDLWDRPDFYYVYFFQKDTVDYFTIWKESYEPLLVLADVEPAISFDFYCFQSYDKNVVLVKRQDDHRQLPFKSSIRSMNLDDTKYFLLKDSMSLREYASMQTYRYYPQGERYHLEELEDTIYLGFKGEQRFTLSLLNARHENNNLALESEESCSFASKKDPFRNYSLKSVKNLFMIPTPTTPIEDYLAPALLKCLRFHQTSYYWCEGYYYNVYFFRKDGVDYFTIWHSPEGPDFVLNESGQKMDYYWFQLYENDIIFVKRHDDQRKLPFDSKISLRDPETIDKIPIVEEVTGHRFNMYTYRYYWDGKDYRVEGLRDTIYLDFPAEGRINYELGLTKRLNERWGLDPKKPYPKF